MTPRRALLSTSAVLLSASLASATTQTWLVDQAHSQLTITGGTVSVSIFSFPIMATAAGSLAAPLAGFVDADLVQGPTTTIQLLSSTRIDAVDHGSYLPGTPASPGTPAPGSFAGKFNTVPFTPTNVMFVTRGAVLSVEDEVRTIIGGAFEADGEMLSVIEGVVDLNVDPFQADLSTAVPAENLTTSPATLTQADGVETLTIPVEFDLDLSSDLAEFHLEFAGTVVATRELTTPCPGDVAGDDGVVNVDDLNAILSNWLVNVGVGSPLDLAGGDGVVNVEDLNVILGNWQASCG